MRVHWSTIEPCGNRAADRNDGGDAGKRQRQRGGEDEGREREGNGCGREENRADALHIRHLSIRHVGA